MYSLKLLSVIVSMDPASGGPAQGIRNNVPFWEQQGIVPSILSFDTPNSSFLEKDKIISIGPAKTAWGYVAKGKDWLLNHLCDYDVVLIHGLWLYNGYAVRKAVKKLKKLGKKVPKVFVMPHGMLDPYFQKAPERKLKAIRNVIYWHLIEKHVINEADGVLFTCEEELQLANTTFLGYNPKSVYNVGYGIVPPPPYSLNQQNAFYGKCAAVMNRPYFLFLSRIHPKKGVDILLKAYAAVCDYCEHNAIILPDMVIAGPGMDTDYGNDLITLQGKFPQLAGKVHYPGMLQGDAKWGALYGSEIFILPSHQENFGIAIVEAMACYKPVIITNKVNIWREIKQENAGIIVNDDLESTIGGIINWLEKTDAVKSDISKNAFQAYRAYFTAEATSRKFVNLLYS